MSGFCMLLPRRVWFFLFWIAKKHPVLFLLSKTLPCYKLEFLYKSTTCACFSGRSAYCWCADLPVWGCWAYKRWKVGIQMVEKLPLLFLVCAQAVRATPK